VNTEFDWKAAVDAVLRWNHYCCLATPDNETGAWANPVYFAYDASYAIYFISLANTKHMRNIQREGKVTLAIYDSRQDTNGDIVGLQIEGAATTLRNIHDIAHAFSTYYSRVHEGKPAESDKKPGDFLDVDSGWLFVKIVPTAFHYFDSKQFGEQRQAVPSTVFPN
jgi:nitroimidazol reductase NimA-like FMN-containing flavoprotein (pyridoxamine 5'-phosphate oxidase superfamily)